MKKLDDEQDKPEQDKPEQDENDLHLVTTEKVYPFTIYSPKEKYILIVILSLVGWWSTVSSPIYFPALPTIRSYFDISDSIADLSVVAYLVFQGVMPTFSSSLADTFGRRPVILISMLCYVGSSIAISQSNVYWLLTVLRCVQAASIGPVIAISSGVSGDVCLAADRGSFVGMVSGMQLTGNAFGGLIGAALINQFGWRGIFIFCSIGCGVTLIFAIFVLPETMRQMVGNGSVKPKYFLNVAPIFLLNHYKKRLTDDVDTLAPKRRFDILAPFKMLGHVDIALTLFPLGLKFAIWTMVLTSLSRLEGGSYQYSVLKVGYIYLPQGVTCFIGSFVSGKLLDISYKRGLAKYESKFGDLPKDEAPEFNSLRTRMTTLLAPCLLQCFGSIIYGWCLQYEMNISSIIISTCMISYASSSSISIGMTILVDLNPEMASTSASLMNLTRCLLAALGTGVLSKMTESMNLGGCYTFWGILSILSDLLLVYLAYWRNERRGNKN